MSVRFGKLRYWGVLVAVGGTLAGVLVGEFGKDEPSSSEPIQSVPEDYPKSWHLEHPMVELDESPRTPIKFEQVPQTSNQWRFNVVPTEDTVQRIGHLQISYSGEQPVEVALRLNDRRFPVDPNALVRKIKSEYSEPIDRALEALKWVSSHSVNLIPPTGAGYPDHDPHMFTNSFRYGFCDDASEHLAQLHGALGVTSRVMGLNGHVVVQSEIDGQVALFDPDYKLAFWNNSDSGLLSRIDVCAQRDHHFYADSVIRAVYSDQKIARLVSILCEGEGRKGTVAASFRKGRELGDSLSFKLDPGGRIDFYPLSRAGRMAMKKPRVEDHARVGHMQIETPLKSDSVFALTLQRKFALPLLSATLRFEVETDHAFEIISTTLSPRGFPLKKSRTPVAVGRSVVLDAVLELSDLAPYPQVDQLNFNAMAQGHPSIEDARVKVTLITTHQIASDAFPLLRTGVNTVALERSGGDLLSGLRWQAGLIAYRDETRVPPVPRLNARIQGETLGLEWEGSSASNIIYEVEFVSEEAPKRPIFPVLAAGLKTSYLNIEGSALDKLQPGQTYRWRVRKRSREGEVGPFCDWQSFKLEL